MFKAFYSVAEVLKGKISYASTVSGKESRKQDAGFGIFTPEQ